jgi:hypothetical protein
MTAASVERVAPNALLLERPALPGASLTSSFGAANLSIGEVDPSLAPLQTIARGGTTCGRDIRVNALIF